jgi:hypothetical protein
MEMLEILKKRLPEGLEVKKVYNRTGHSQMKILFTYGGHEIFGWLNKTCAPGCAEKECDFSICAVMLGIALETHDLASAKHWVEKQKAITGDAV